MGRFGQDNPLGRYVLGGRDGKTPVPCPDLMEWGHWMEQGGRHVAMTGNDGRFVSTVFLALDHNFGFGEDKRPILFETMIFGFPEHEGYQERYRTWDEAEAGHKRAVALAFPALVKA